MSKDIRNFFFGSKPTPASAPQTIAAAKPAAKTEKSAREDDPLLIDSDDDDPKTTQRKRLKTTKQAAAPNPAKQKATEPAPIASPARRTTAPPDRGFFQSPMPPHKAPVKSPSKGGQSSTSNGGRDTTPVKRDSPPVLPVLTANPIGSPVKIVREVKGGASAFFGEGPSLPAHSELPVPPTSKRANTAATATDLTSPAKAPRTSADVKSPPATKASAAVKSPPSSGRKRKADPTPTTATTEAADSPAAAATAGSGLCFEGLKIAVTGVFDGAGRDGIEDLVLTHGGKVASAVSGKTNFLVAGVRLEDGRPAEESSKYKAAVEKKVPIIGEEEFMARIAAHEAKAAAAAERSAGASVSSVSQGSAQTTAASQSQGTASGIPPNPFARSGSSTAAVNRSTVPVRAPTLPTSTSAASNINSGTAATGAGSGGDADALWVDKYRPQSSAAMIGSTEIVSKLTAWLRRWDAVHLHKTEKVPFSKENPGARAALLSGPPGIGKSTVAALAAKEGGYDVLELNASDTRNKREIEAQLSNAVTCQAISNSNVSGSGGASRKRLVIMDEVDGMGGSDRGGIAELIKVIKSSRIPIICICNDRQSTKIRSLVNHCYDLKVRRPTKQQIANRLVAIAKGEGMQLEQNAAEMLVEQAGNDIRQSLNCMQMWRASGKNMSYGDVKAGMNRIEKDKILRLSPFDACGSILGGNKTSFDDRYNAFFIDYSLTPLLIQQNYIDSAKNGIFKQPNIDDVTKMQMLSRASDAVADSDLAEASIRGQNMHWELLTTQAVFCVRAGAFVQGFQPFPSFPAWLGKHSSRNKMNRLTKEIVHHTSLSIGQGFLPIRLDYVPYLRQSLLQALQRVQAGSCEVEEVVALLDAYGLTREDFAENMKELQMVIEGDKVLTDQYASLDTKTKTALTKAYNSVAHTSQVLVSELAVKAKKGKATRGGNDDDDDLLDEEAREERALLAAEEEEKGDEESGDEDISALVSKKPAARGKKAAAAGGGASSGAGASGSGGAAAAKGKAKGKAAK